MKFLKLLTLNFRLKAINIQNIFEIHYHRIGLSLQSMDTKFSQQLNVLGSFHLYFSKEIDA